MTGCCAPPAPSASVGRPGLDEGTSIKIHLSKGELECPDCAADLHALLHELDLDARLVSPELTETEPVSDSVSALETVRRLRGFGIELSIEHFGAVSSSLMDLKRLSIGELKMDKSFAVRQDLGLRGHSARTGTNPPTRRG